MLCVFYGVFGEKYDFAEFSRPFSAILEISQNWPPELQEVQPLSTVPKAPRGGGRRPPPGRVPPRHARSLQICSKLFFLPSDTIRAKITPFAAFSSFVKPRLSGCQQRVALGASQNTEVSTAMYLHLMRDLLAIFKILSKKVSREPKK